MAQLVSAPPCHGGGRGFKSRQGRSDVPTTGMPVTEDLGDDESSGSVAQLVERSTENRKVTGSTPVGATTSEGGPRGSGGLFRCVRGARETSGPQYYSEIYDN